MLAYAASRPTIAARRSSPQSMLLIASVHVVAIAVLMSAKMELPLPIRNDPIDVDLIELPKPPPPEDPARPRPPRPIESTVFKPRPNVPIVPIADPPIVDVTSTPDFNRDVAPVLPRPHPELRPAPEPVRIGARLTTPESQLKPPYPRSKLLSEEEAALPLRLTIDERGRVIAVEAVGPADPVFLEAARRHLLARWRYSPAREGGRPIRSTVKITLRFQLDG